METIPSMERISLTPTPSLQRVYITLHADIPFSESVVSKTAENSIIPVGINSLSTQLSLKWRLIYGTVPIEARNAVGSPVLGNIALLLHKLYSCLE
jgi:hypothetical protein